VFVLMVVLLSVGAGLILMGRTSAAELAPRSLELSDSTAGATNVTYQTAFTLATAGAVGSISIEFCSNSPLLTDPCTAPNGLDVSGAVLTNQTGATGFSISSSSTANDIILTRPSTVNAAVSASYTFSSITNPSADGSHYGRFLTYASSDASGPSTDTGGVAFALNAAVDVNAVVPPFLLFCSGNTIAAFDCNAAVGNYLDLGDLSATHAGAGTSQLLVATNGQSGYGISVKGTTLESGNNVLRALTAPTTSQPGTSQFGINLRANTNPTVGANPTGPGTGAPTANYDAANEFTYNANDLIARATQPEDYRKYTVSYLANITTSQPVGIYASTFTYVALANF
jgi:hypothetical protein